MTTMLPFFCYYGGKWRAAPHYPKPRHRTIVEPFAGAAGYATRYPDHQVHLFDVDPVICGVWDYLIHASVAEIQRLPDTVAHVDDVNAPQEAKWLIGFWLNKGAASPCKKPSAWARGGLRPNSFWGDTIRQRLASQVGSIRHWTITNGGYDHSPNMSATWFVDPPYQLAGRHYRHTFAAYTELGAWCKARQGQVIVCENEGADWLPFQPFKHIKTTPGAARTGKSTEVVWLNQCTTASEAA